MVDTSDFPQADRLEQVGKVAIAVAKGNRSDDEIEDFIGLGSAGRQGRYYRRAAEILGLITTSQNYSSLTALGKEFASISSSTARSDFLAQCLLETPVFRAALDYIFAKKPSEAQLRAWFRNFYPGESSTAGRRYSTFRNYLFECGLIKYVGHQITVSKYSGAVTKQKISSVEQLRGKSVHQKAVKPPEAWSGQTISYDIDSQKMERANQTHWNLITAKSAFLDHRGFPAFENEHIDLYTHSENGDILLYEMKSIFENNLIAQIRKAIAQLYEYRFVFSAPNANLCIVTNAPIPKTDTWLLDYLGKDRNIAYEWTEDFENFECSVMSNTILNLFAP